MEGARHLRYEAAGSISLCFLEKLILVVKL